MKKLLLLTMVAALAAVALYFALSSRGAEDRGESIATTEAAPGETPAPSSAPVAAPPEDQAPAGAELASEREARQVDPEPSLPPDRLCTLTVVAALSKAAPRDDDAQILVFGKVPEKTDADLELSKLSPGDPFPPWIVAHAPANPLGATEIALERRATPVGVGLWARFSFAKPELRVDVSGERGKVELTTHLGACVRGRLVAPAGASAAERDFAGSELALNSDPLEANFGGSSDWSRRADKDAASRPDGTFEFGGVAAVADLTLTGRPPHLAAFKQVLPQLAPGKVHEVEIPLQRGANVRGRVLGPDRAPVAGADVAVRTDPVMLGLGGRILRKAKSDAEGKFALEAVAAGKVMVDAKATGHLDTTREVELAEGAVIDDFALLLETGALIEGTVRWDGGSPAADVEVEVEFDKAQLVGMGAINAAHGNEGDARTNAEGRFSVGGLGKGPFTVAATARPADAGADSAEWHGRQDGVKPGTLDVELTLRRPSKVAGKVVDDLGAPVTDCTVVVAAKGRNAWIKSDEQWRIAVRNEGGTFETAELFAGSYTATALLESGASSPAVAVAVPQAEGAPELVLTLPRPALVSGRVLLPDGTPAAGARVSKQSGMMDIMAGQVPGSEAAAVTKEDGTFRHESLPMGPLVLHATKSGYAPSATVPLELAPTKQVEDVTLVLRKGGTITGEVYDAGGQAKAGARILSQMQDMSYGQFWTSSDGAGKFEFLHMPPGGWQVMTFGDQAAGDGAGDSDESKATSAFLKNMKLAMATVKDGESVHVVLGAPPQDPVKVRVRVAVAGAPVQGAMVSFFPRDGAKSGGGLTSLKMDTTGAEGRCEVDLDHPGPYLVTVQKITSIGGQQSIEFPREIPAEAAHALELELPVGTITGRITNPGGDPVPGARVSLGVDGALRSGTLTGGRYSEVQADERGEYALEWLSAGRYSVAAGGMSFTGLGQETSGRQVRDGIEVAEGQRVERIDFRLPKACKLTGKVVDGGGKPVAGAAIFLRDAEGRALERFSMTSSDSGGSFVQDGLAAGRYLVTARSASLVTSEEASVLVREDEPNEVVLHVDSGTMLVVKVTNAEDAPIEASVGVTDDKGRQVNGLFSLAELMKLMSDGGYDAKEQRVGPLPPGKYTVTAVAPDGTQVVKSVTLLGQTERKLTLKLGN